MVIHKAVHSMTTGQMDCTNSLKYTTNARYSSAIHQTYAVYKKIL